MTTPPSNHVEPLGARLSADSTHDDHDRPDDRAPAVSVLVAAYNCGDELRPSLVSLLEQTHGDFEIVVVDDGSTDDSFQRVDDLVSDPRIVLIRQPNAGKAAALNHAVERSRGGLLMIHDGDDVSEPRRVEVLARTLTDEPDLGAVLSRHSLLIGDRNIAPRRRGADRKACAQAIAEYRQPAHDPTVMFRRSAVDDPVFDPELRIGQGVDLVLRLGERHPMVVVADPLYRYRIDPGSTTRRDSTATTEFSRLVVQKAATRRGEAPPTPTGAPPAWPYGHVIDATLDARLLDGRGAAVRTLVDAVRAAGVSWPWWRALVYAVAPMRLVVRRRPDAHRHGGRR